MAKTSTVPLGITISDDEEDKEVWCAICLSILRRPRQLPCGHAYCLHCLAQLAPRNSRNMQCPNCRRTALLPAEGVQQLPVDPHLLQEVHRIREKKRQKKRDMSKKPCSTCNEYTTCIQCPHCNQEQCSECRSQHALDLRNEVDNMISKLEKVKKQLQKEDLQENKTFKENLENCSSKDTKRVLSTLKRALATSKSFGKASKMPIITDQEEIENLAHQHMFLHKLEVSLEARLSTCDAFTLGATTTSNRGNKHQMLRRTGSSNSESACHIKQNILSNTNYKSETNGIKSINVYGSLRINNVGSVRYRTASAGRSKSKERRFSMTDEKHPIHLLLTDSVNNTDIQNNSSTFTQGDSDPESCNTSAFSKASLYNSQPYLRIIPQPRLSVMCGDININDVPAIESNDYNLDIDNADPKSATDFDPCNSVSDTCLADFKSKSRQPITVKEPTSNVNQICTDHRQALEDQSLYYRCKPSRSKQRLQQTSALRRPTDVTWCRWNNAIYVTSSQFAKVIMYPRTGQGVTTCGRLSTNCSNSFQYPNATGGCSNDKFAGGNNCKSMADDVRTTCGLSGREGKPFSFGVRGNGPGLLLCPSAVVCSPLIEELYVLDKWRSRVLVFSLNGIFLREWGAKGHGKGEFSSPEALTGDDRGLLYVADTCNDRVQVINKDGQVLRQVGGHELRQPAGVAVSGDGVTILVADTGNHKCRVYCGKTGRLLQSFGGRGFNQGQMDSPECVALDPYGFMLIGDSGNNRIQIFRPNGNFVRYLGSRNGRDGELKLITGLAVLPTQEVLAADFAQHTVMVY